MLRWFHALMPKEESFFDLFAQHSRAVVAGAQALRAEDRAKKARDPQLHLLKRAGQ